MGQVQIDDERAWEGDAEALARQVALWARRLSIEDTSELTVRLIRDYAQRGILERPRREGKIAIYGWDQLVQLLAARKLLSEGWPLQKIAELFLVSSVDEIRALLPGPPPLATAALEDPALADLRRIRRKAGAEPHLPKAASADRAFDRMRRDSVARHSMRSAQETIGPKAQEVRSRQMTRIEIAPGVELTIETRRLKEMGLREAEAIARAVGLCLTDPNLRHKGDDKDD